jgi:hypothetical protein
VLVVLSETFDDRRRDRGEKNGFPGLDHAGDVIIGFVFVPFDEFGADRALFGIVMRERRRSQLIAANDEQGAPIRDVRHGQFGDAT